MKTIKLPYKTNENLTEIIKQCSSVIRYSYNRFCEGKTYDEINIELREQLERWKNIQIYCKDCGMPETLTDEQQSFWFELFEKNEDLEYFAAEQIMVEKFFRKK